MTNSHIPLSQISASPAVPAAALGSAENVGGDPSLRAKVEKVINLIRPAVQSDGGDVELVEITPDGTVCVRLHGACVGCPSSTMTLQLGLERNLKAHIPAIRGVRALE